MSVLLNLLGPRQGFEGGLFLPEFKSATARRPIEHVFADRTLFVPLQVADGWETRVDVARGERVVRGQRLATATVRSSTHVHAPTSGTVTDFSRVWTPHQGYLPCAVLEPDGRDESLPRNLGWMGESFVGQLADHGVICDSPLLPAAEVLHRAATAGVTELIVSAMETEPYLTADLRTLVEQPGRLMDITCELADALGVARAIFAMPFRHRRVARRISEESRGRYIEVVPLSNRYPQCHPIILVKTLLDREVPPGGSTLDVGAVVVPLSMVRMAAEAVYDDTSVTHATLTVAGDAVEHAGTYRVPIGTTLHHLADRVGLLAPVEQAVFGGPLTGVAVSRDDAVITADTTAILLFSRAERPEPVPCIHCGWCVEDCPVGVDPSSLAQLESEPSADAMTMAHLSACIDCGLCSYVCPASLPLAATIRRSRSRFSTRAHPSGGA